MIADMHVCSATLVMTAAAGILVPAEDTAHYRCNGCILNTAKAGHGCLRH
jgi:hypothetical protein